MCIDLLNTVDCRPLLYVCVCVCVCVCVSVDELVCDVSTRQTVTGRLTESNQLETGPVPVCGCVCASVPSVCVYSTASVCCFSLTDSQIEPSSASHPCRASMRHLVSDWCTCIPAELACPTWWLTGAPEIGRAHV